MKRSLVFLMVLVLCLAIMPFSGKADDKPDKVSYYQYPVDKTLQPATIWNPVITEDRTKDRVYKSYYQYNPNPVQPAGSFWNPLITTDEGKLK